MSTRWAMMGALAVALAGGCGGRLAPGGPECGDEVLASTTDNVREVAADEKAVVWGTSTGDVFERSGTTTTLRANVSGYVDSVALWGDAILVATGARLFSLAPDAPPVEIASGGRAIRSVQANAHGVFYIDGDYSLPTTRLFHVTASGPVLLLEANGYPAPFVLDGDNLYFAMMPRLNGVDHQGALVRIHLTDYTMETLTTGLTIYSLAVERDWLYAGTCDGCETLYPDYPIVRISKASGGASTIGKSQYAADAIVVDGGALYALTYRDMGESILLRMGTDGSAPTVLAASGGVGFGYFSSLRTTAHTVVWTTSQDEPYGIARSDLIPAVRRMCK